MQPDYEDCMSFDHLVGEAEERERYLNPSVSAA
jgi:hypothetical protein